MLNLCYTQWFNWQTREALRNRPLAKLKLQFKITNTGDEVESQTESFSPVSIAFGKDSKTLDETDGMLITHALT